MTFQQAFNRIIRNIRKIKNQEMAEYHLRSFHISCLYYLYLSKGLTATDLCERCEEDKATISRSLDYLETNNYLICESKSTKRYKSPLILTDKGIVSNGLTVSLEEVIKNNGVSYTIYDKTQPNPTVHNVEEALALYHQNYCIFF